MSSDASEDDTKKRTKADSDSEYSDDKRRTRRPKKAKKIDTSHNFDLGKNRKITVRDFKGQTLIDIREYYEDKNGEVKPGKKGISLTVDQWKALQSKIDEVNGVLSE